MKSKLLVDQHMETPLNNTKHLEWCNKQEPFNLSIIRQKIKTREFNKLQNLFLENENIEKLLCFMYEKNVKYEFSTVDFEGPFNWNIIIGDLSFKKHNYGYCDKHILGNIYIEIEPLLGDDYQCVLQKIKYQKELTLNTSKIQEPCNFVLLIGEYNSLSTSRDTLIKIFKKSGIDVVFIDDLEFKDNKLSKIHLLDKEVEILFKEIKESLTEVEEDCSKINDIINELNIINDINTSNKNNNCRIL